MYLCACVCRHGNTQKLTRRSADLAHTGGQGGGSTEEDRRSGGERVGETDGRPGRRRGQARRQSPHAERHTKSGARPAGRAGGRAGRVAGRHRRSAEGEGADMSVPLIRPPLRRPVRERPPPRLGPQSVPARAAVAKVQGAECRIRIRTGAIMCNNVLGSEFRRERGRTRRPREPSGLPERSCQAEN